MTESEIKPGWIYYAGSAAGRKVVRIVGDRVWYRLAAMAGQHSSSLAEFAAWAQTGRDCRPPTNLVHRPIVMSRRGAKAALVRLAKGRVR